MSDFGHYFRDCPHERIDVYRVLQLFGVIDPCLQHALKKLIAAGARGHKNIDRDVGEAIASLKRWQEMRREDLDAIAAPPDPRFVSEFQRVPLQEFRVRNRRSGQERVIRAEAGKLFTLAPDEELV